MIATRNTGVVAAIMRTREYQLGLRDGRADSIAEINSLHAAVASLESRLQDLDGTARFYKNMALDDECGTQLDPNVLRDLSLIAIIAVVVFVIGLIGGWAYLSGWMVRG